MSEKNLPAVPANVDGLRKILTAMKSSMEEVLPKFMTPERMLKIAMLAATRQPKLYQCTTPSLMQAVMTASEVGLECSGTMGQGYLIPYKNKGILEATFVPGYRGLIALMVRDGDVSHVTVHLVHENDAFNIDYFADPPIHHKPCIRGERGPMIGAYAAATLPDGAIQVEYMTKEEIDAIRKRSKAADGGPWATDYGEMARKTPVRRLSKYVPLGLNAAAALAAAVAAEDKTFGTIDIEGSAAPPAQNRPEVDFSPPAIEAPEKPSEEPAGVEGGEKPAADATDATAAQEAPTEKAKDESDDLGL